MLTIDIEELNFSKLNNGLLPAIICCATTNTILMQGFMNKESLLATIECRQVVFFSRTKNDLWKKGETSGNFLDVKKIEADCDSDCLLIYVLARNSTCHLGTVSCFAGQSTRDCSGSFLQNLQNIIAERIYSGSDGSYVKKLNTAGTEFIAAKVIEEAVEFAQACKKETPERSIAEAADLLFHFLVLLENKNIAFANVVEELRGRNLKKSST